MSIEKNNNINIILIDSLESLHQKEFGLQSSQQKVVLACHCHERLTNIKDGMKMEEKWSEMDRPYLSAPTLALTILFANSGLHFLHFSSVPRFSIYHYAFDGLALLLLLVPSTCAAIGHWLKFIFWFYVFDATSFCVNLPGMYNPFE